jgi:hypothetical protein
MTHSRRCSRHSLRERWSKQITCLYLTRKGNVGEGVRSNEGGGWEFWRSDNKMTPETRPLFWSVLVSFACPQLSGMIRLKVMQTICAGGLPIWCIASSVNFHKAGLEYAVESSCNILLFFWLPYWTPTDGPNSGLTDGRRRKFERSGHSCCLHNAFTNKVHAAEFSLRSWWLLKRY